MQSIVNSIINNVIKQKIETIQIYKEKINLETNEFQKKLYINELNLLSKELNNLENSNHIVLKI